MQLVKTRVDMHSCSQLTMATSVASSSSLSGTSLSEAEGTSRQSDSGHSDTTSPGSPLSTKKKKLRHIDRKYQPEWSLKYQGVKRSKKGSTYAHCVMWISL